MLMGYSKGSASGPAPSSMCGWSGRVVGEVVWAGGLGEVAWARWRALVPLAAVWPFACAR